jgi:hypothetical protein
MIRQSARNTAAPDRTLVLLIGSGAYLVSSLILQREMNPDAVPAQGGQGFYLAHRGRETAFFGGQRYRFCPPYKEISLQH